MSLSLNPYAPACFAPRDRLTWLHIMSETLESSEVDLNRNEQIIINRAHDFTHNGDEGTYLPPFFFALVLLQQVLDD